MSYTLCRSVFGVREFVRIFTTYGSGHASKKFFFYSLPLNVGMRIVCEKHCEIYQPIFYSHVMNIKNIFYLFSGIVGVHLLCDKH